MKTSDRFWTVVHWISWLVIAVSVPTIIVCDDIICRRQKEAEQSCVLRFGPHAEVVAIEPGPWWRILKYCPSDVVLQDWNGTRVRTSTHSRVRVGEVWSVDKAGCKDGGSMIVISSRWGGPWREPAR